MRPKPARKGFIENPFESKQPGQALGTHDSIARSDRSLTRRQGGVILTYRIPPRSS